MARSVTTAEFPTEVLHASKPVLVDFWAVWCGPCRMVSPILDQLAEENADRIDVVKVNVDENPELAAQYGVVSIPTLIMFANGNEAQRLIGARPKPGIIAEFKDFLG